MIETKPRREHAFDSFPLLFLGDASFLLSHTENSIYIYIICLNESKYFFSVNQT